MKSTILFLMALGVLCGVVALCDTADAIPTNLAINGTASASNEHTDAFLYGPENAIDGLRSSRNAFNDEIIWHGLQTSADPNTQYQSLWYEVDLGADYHLDRVQLFSRLSPSSFNARYYASAQQLIRDFRIDVFNTAGENVFSQSYLPSTSTDDEPWAASDMRGVIGSRVRITRDPRHKILGLGTSSMALAEFEVWGQTTPLLTNLALGRPVTASPHRVLGAVALTPEKAVDGDLSGHYWHNSVFESDPTGGDPFVGPYGNGHFWQVELETLSTISHVTIFARTDGEPSDAQAAGAWAGGVFDFHNGAIRISVVGSDGTSLIDFIDTTLGGDDLGMQRYDLTEVFASNPVGKYVRIESLDTTKTLTFGEVEVFGTAVSSLGRGVEVPEPSAAIVSVGLGLLLIACGNKRFRRPLCMASALLGIGCLTASTAHSQPINLSLGGTATASSTLGGNVPANVIDGNRVGNIIWHSRNDIPASYGEQHWLQVDLGSEFYLDRLQIFARNQFQDTVKNFTLTVFDSSDNVVFSELFLENKTTGDTAWGTNAFRNVKGSKVRIIRDPPHAQWDRAMTFAEFEIYGQATPIGPNLAEGRPVTSTTSLVDAGPTGPELANDGIIGGHFWLESVFVSDGVDPPFPGPYGNGHFWQVELDEPSAIDYVNVFARSDVVTQNGPIRITLLGADGTTVVTSADTTLGGTDFNTNRFDVTQVFVGAPVASFVRIEALDTTLKLALAEVEVIGLVPAVIGLPGDFNGDGIVDAGDYIVWRNALGSNDPDALGGNGDETGASQGVVDTADYLLWKGQFGAVAPTSLGAAVAVVPEPATGLAMSLLLIGLGVAVRKLPGRCT